MSNAAVQVSPLRMRFGDVPMTYAISSVRTLILEWTDWGVGAEILRRSLLPMVDDPDHTVVKAMPWALLTEGPLSPGEPVGAPQTSESRL